MKRSATNQLIQKVKKFRNVKKEANNSQKNPFDFPENFIDNRTEIMVNFAKQFHKANLTDRSLLPKLLEYRRTQKLPKHLHRGQLTPEVVQAIEDNVLPHFYKHASKTMSILSVNGLDTWTRHIWYNFVHQAGKPLHPLMKSDKALTSFMNASLNLLQPDAALDIYTDHITYKLDKRAVTLALQALGKMKRWDEMKHLFRIYNEKRPYQVDFIMVKVMLNIYSKEQKYDEVVELLQKYIKELNDDTELVLMGPLYNCKSHKDMARILEWTKNVRKNVHRKRDAVVRMFSNVKPRFPRLKTPIDAVTQNIKKSRVRRGGKSSGKGAPRTKWGKGAAQGKSDAPPTETQSVPQTKIIPQEQV